MTGIKFSSDVQVELIRHMADDSFVVQAARVSTKGAASEATADAGLIGYLMKGRHGSPFEHTMFTFRVTAPIFVWREHHRHRAGWSYNEESGRYKELDPHFYVPGEDRKLVQVGKPGHYTFEEGSGVQWDLSQDALKACSGFAYANYVDMLDAGIAREVARMVLPLNIMSTCYATCNARSLMHFLSLRTEVEAAMFPSHPQREIAMVAEKYEAHFAELMPLTYKAFVENGRVAP